MKDRVQAEASDLSKLTGPGQTRQREDTVAHPSQTQYFNINPP